MNLLEGDRLPDMSKKWQPLIPYKCENYLTPETLKAVVLNSPEIDRICKFHSGGDDKKEAQLRNVVKSLLEEIGFKRNMTVIRFLGITLNKILLQMTLGVYVNKSEIYLVKRELAQSRCPVLYLPSHRSYADFVLMSYMCFAHDLEIPVYIILSFFIRISSCYVMIVIEFFVVFSLFQAIAAGMGEIQD